jgi:hypothetical protein
MALLHYVCLTTGIGLGWMEKGKGYRIWCMHGGDIVQSIFYINLAVPFGNLRYYVMSLMIS